MDKKLLSERDICSKFITPAILQSGWVQSQFREEVKLTEGRVAVRGTMAARIKNPDAKGGPKRADYVLYALPDMTLSFPLLRDGVFFFVMIHSLRGWFHKEEDQSHE